MTSTSNNNSTKSVMGEKCPVCKSAVLEEYAPFCSKRCADVDLHRWLSGGYAIPAVEDDSDGIGEE